MQIKHAFFSKTANQNGKKVQDFLFSFCKIDKISNSVRLDVQ